MSSTGFDQLRFGSFVSDEALSPAGTGERASACPRANENSTSPATIQAPAPGASATAFSTRSLNASGLSELHSHRTRAAVADPLVTPTAQPRFAHDS